VVAVAGVPGDSTTFYFGAVNGGIWKTSDAGTVWTPIFDDQPVGSIGAIAVAPSDPKTIYAGTRPGSLRTAIIERVAGRLRRTGTCRWSMSRASIVRRFQPFQQTRCVGGLKCVPDLPGVEFNGHLIALSYRSCSVGRINISLTATCLGRVTMKTMASAMSVASIVCPNWLPRDLSISGRL